MAPIVALQLVVVVSHPPLPLSQGCVGLMVGLVVGLVVGDSVGEVVGLIVGDITGLLSSELAEAASANNRRTLPHMTQVLLSTSKSHPYIFEICRPNPLP